MALTTTLEQVQASYRAIVRTDLTDAQAQATVDAIDNGTATLAQYQTSLIQQVLPTTQAAIAVSAFITGTVPADAAKLDSLTEFATLQNDYYTNTLQSSNAALGAYEALGLAYATDATTSAAFAANYGSLSTADFINAAYGQVFNGATPSTGAFANLTAQIEYFTNLYIGAGISAEQASLQAKGAVLGQIIGYATLSSEDSTVTPNDTYEESIAAALQQLADDAIAEVDSAVYGSALGGISQGATITVAAGENVSLDNVDPLFKSTVFSDTILGTIDGNNINTAAGDDFIGTATTKVTIVDNAANVIDGSGGTDSLYGTVGATGITQGSIANVEKIYLGSSAAATVDATKITGATEIWSHETAADLTFTGLAAGVTVGVDTAAAGTTTTFGFADDITAATVAIKALNGSTVGVTGTDLETVTFNVQSNSVAAIDVAATVTTVNVSGTGEFAITELTKTVETFDASTATSAVALGTATAFDGAAATTIKLGTGNDVLNVGFGDEFQDSITLGAGSDAVTVDTAAFANVSLTGTTVATFADFTDFTKGQDTITFSGLSAFSGSLVGQGTIEQALAVVAADANAGTGVYFEFAGNTFIFQDEGSASLGAGDGLIRLTGVTGLTFDATAGTLS